MAGKKSRGTRRSDGAGDSAPQPSRSVAQPAGTWDPIVASRSFDAPTEAAAIDHMVLEIRWSGGEGRLQGLVDNGTTVKFPDMPKGPAGVRATWDSAEASAHFLQFAVVFEGTRTNLSASGTMDGVGGFDEPVRKKSADTIWVAAGDVVPEGGR